MTRSFPELTARPTLRVLSNEQIENMHLATLKVLERTGVRITHEKALELFDGAGAKIDRDRVRIPAAVIEKAIQQSQAPLVLGRRNGEIAFSLENGRSWFGAGLDCPKYLDPTTGTRRPFTSDDCRVMATIASVLPNYAWAMTLGMAADVKAEIADRVIAKQAMTYCEKPLAFCCNDIESLKAIHDMALVIAGSEKAFRRAPAILHLSSPVSPLLFYDDTIERIIFCAEKGIPQILYPGLQTGGTSPATFAGTIVQGSAESLSGLALAQLVQAGAPAVYGALTTIMDMTTAVFSFGAPEMSLMTAAMSQMAQHYNLPFFGTAGCSDAKFHDDPQAAAEATFSCLSSALSQAGLIHDAGFLDHSTLISPEYLVLVNEVISMVNKYTGGILLNDETLALDVIDRVGPGGHYLTEPHTVKHLGDVWYSQLFERSSHEDWRRNGEKHFKERLYELTRKMMAVECQPLSSEIIAEMDRMAKGWE